MRTALHLLAALLLALAGAALLLIGEPSPTLIGLALLWGAGLVVLRLKGGRARPPAGR